MSKVVQETSDGRLRRGVKSRLLVLDAAVDLASLDGLDALSFARVATSAGLSKAGVQGLFGTKEELQVATVGHARNLFIDAVVDPASSARRGLPRLRSLLKHWIVYADAPLFPGGCFRVANLATFDSRTGPVHNALARDQSDWVSLLESELRIAVEAGEIAPRDTDRTAFEIDAVLCATNTALRFGDTKAVSRARKIFRDVLEPLDRD